MSGRFFRIVLLAGLFACPLSARAAEKVERKLGRPGEGEAPIKVQFLVFVLDIDNIDGAGQSFAANFYVHLRWQDKRLAHSGPSAQKVPLEEIWDPRVIVANPQGYVRPSLPEVAEVAPDGTVTYRQRYVGSLSQPLNLSDFPLDRHRFAIQFVAPGNVADQLEFVPDVYGNERKVTGGEIADTLSLPDWRILSYRVVPEPFEPVEGVRVAGFAFEFTAERYFLYYLWQVIVPLMVIVGMSWAAFWIDPSQAGAQLGLAGSSILSLIAYRFVLTNLLPRLPYMTRMDYFTLGSTILVFLALVQVITTSSLGRGKRVRLARRIDRVARFVFPAIFVGLFVWSLLL